jgi:hypothetical protein
VLFHAQREQRLAAWEEAGHIYTHLRLGRVRHHLLWLYAHFMILAKRSHGCQLVFSSQ